MAGAGREALRVAAACPSHIDVVITSVSLPDADERGLDGPGLDGPGLAARIESERPLIRVLFMSGWVEDLDGLFRSVRTRSSFIQKPFAPRELLKKVQELIPA